MKSQPSFKKFLNLFQHVLNVEKKRQKINEIKFWLLHHCCKIRIFRKMWFSLNLKNNIDLPFHIQLVSCLFFWSSTFPRLATRPNISDTTNSVCRSVSVPRQSFCTLLEISLIFVCRFWAFATTVCFGLFFPVFDVESVSFSSLF